jgi:hypothetical protein
VVARRVSRPARHVCAFNDVGLRLCLAESDPCQGRNLRNSAGGWLETCTWERFDTWLYSRAPVYQGDNYSSEEGSQEMTEAEITELSDWSVLV